MYRMWKWKLPHACARDFSLLFLVTLERISTAVERPCNKIGHPSDIIFASESISWVRNSLPEWRRSRTRGAARRENSKSALKRRQCLCLNNFRLLGAAFLLNRLTWNKQDGERYIQWFLYKTKPLHQQIWWFSRDHVYLIMQWPIKQKLRDIQIYQEHSKDCCWFV